jgi:hypothetical protein
MTNTSHGTKAGRTIALLIMTAAIAAAPAAAADVGWVAAIEGTAEVQRGGSWSGLTQGAILQLGDHVRTAAASRAKLLFQDDSVLTLGESAELVVDESVAGGAPTTSFSLLLGKMRAVVNERYSAAGAKFEVKTPTAIAGVRGTSFVAGYDKNKDETLVVGIEDTTAVRSLAQGAGNEVLLWPGQSTVVGRGKVPTRPVTLPASAIDGLTRETTTADRGKDAGTPGAADPRLPRRPGERDGSPEGRVIDQPVDLLRNRPVPPPPPPVR